MAAGSVLLAGWSFRKPSCCRGLHNWQSDAMGSLSKTQLYDAQSPSQGHRQSKELGTTLSLHPEFLSSRPLRPEPQALTHKPESSCWKGVG